VRWARPGASGDGAIVQSTLARNGTFAWIGRSGRLLVMPPRAGTPIVAAEASAAPAQLASSDATIYWTAGGVAERWHR
jgi:hypothetical protein